MRRHRIYYVIWLAFCGMLFGILRERYTAALFFSFLLLPLLSLCVTALAFLYVRAGRSDLPTSALKGSLLQMEIEVENRSFLFCPYTLIRVEGAAEAEGKPGMVYTPETEAAFLVPPRSRMRQTVTVKFLLRGTYPMDETLEALDFLKLFRFTKKAGDVRTVWVYPQIREIRFSPDMLRQNGVEQASVQASASLQENSDVFDLRAYEERDDIKHIHWKLSAKGNELLVKQYAETHRTQALVAVDLSSRHETSPECQDQILEAAVSLLNHYTIERKTVDFLYADTQIRREKVESVKKFREIHHLSAVLAFTGALPLDIVLGQYVPEGRQPLTMFLLTSSIDAALRARIDTLSAYGHRVILIDFGPDSFSEKDISADYLRPQELYQ